MNAYDHISRELAERQLALVAACDSQLLVDENDLELMDLDCPACVAVGGVCTDCDQLEQLDDDHRWDGGDDE